MIEPEIPAGAREIPAEVVIQQASSGVGDRLRTVIVDAVSWTSLWNDAYAGRIPQVPVPSIDFAGTSIIVAATGGRPTGGFSIAIEKVYDADGVLYALVVATSPGPTCGVTQATTAPLAAVRVGRPEANVVFVEKSVTRLCD